MRPDTHIYASPPRAMCSGPCEERAPVQVRHDVTRTRRGQVTCSTLYSLSSRFFLTLITFQVSHQSSTYI